MATATTQDGAAARYSRQLHLTFAAGLALVVCVAVAMVLDARRYEHDASWVTHSTAVRATLGRMQLHLYELGDGQAEPQAQLQMLSELEQLAMLVRDEPQQSLRATTLRQLLKDPLVNRAQARGVAEDMRNYEIELQQARKERARTSLDHIYAKTGVGILFALALFMLAWSGISKELVKQREAVQALKYSEAQAAALLENGVDAMWAVDPSLKLTACNRRFRKLVEDTLDGGAILTERPDGTITLADYTPWQDAYRRALDGERLGFEEMHEVRGHQRYFLISFGPILVDGKVTGAAAFAKDITTRKRAELKLQQRAETLHYLSVVDQMTHLYNRRGFLELGGPLLREARNQGMPVALLFCDLDGLKTLNDSLGHAAGDALICAGGDALRESVRRTDLVGRLGGDEFVVLAIGLEDETVLIDRIQAKLAAQNVRMSIGIARDEPGDDSKTLEQLIERADAAMYDEKVARKKKMAESKRLAAV